MFQPDVRAQDTVFVIISVARTKQGRNLAWDFIKQNWATFLARYEVGRVFVLLWSSRRVKV